MKILMMVFQFPPAHRGGAELQCWKQARALAARGHEVTILTEWLLGSSARRETQDGVVIRRLGSLLPVATALWRLHRFLRAKVFTSASTRSDSAGAAGARSIPERVPKKFRWMAPVEWMGLFSFILETMAWVRLGRSPVDVVHVHESHWLAGLGEWIGEATGVPVFCKEALQPVLRYDGFGAVPWSRVWKGMRLKCRYMAMHPGIAAELEAAGISRQRIVEVPNGVEIPAIRATPSQYADAIYVGNFSQGAAHPAFDVLIEALGKAHQLEAGMRLRLFGGGDSRRWQTLAEDQGSGSSVVFEGKTEDVWAAHRQAGFLVLPSRMEGLSNALLEAMASGLSAVVSDIPGNVAVVRHGIEGLVVPVGDVQALAEAMVRLYRSPDLRARMGQAARARVMDLFAIEHVAARLESVYAQAIGTGLERRPFLNFED